MSSSRSSTPSGTMTPPPMSGGGAPSGAGSSEGPSPLMIGTRFVKQYYQVLSTKPDQIFRFYQPTSVLSHGVGSQPAQPTTFEALQQGTTQLKDRFSQEGYEDCAIRFEFEHGAIDAQVSVNGAVLLVVTGHIVYLALPDSEEEDVVQPRKAFVHTFFLGTMGSNRNYFVQNDVLRFLQDDEEKTVVVSNKTLATATVDAKPPAVELPKEDPPVDEVPASPEEEPPAEIAPVAEVEKDNTEIVDAPGGGVEESKEVLIGEEEEEEGKKQVPASTVSEVEQSDEKEPGASDAPTNGKTSRVEAESGKSTSTAPAAGKPPNSWASLFRGGSSSAAAAAASSAPSTPPPTSTPKSKQVPVAVTPTEPPPPAAASPAPDQPASSSSEPNSLSHNTATNSNAHPNAGVGGPGGGGGRGRMNKRDPDCTLVIKNIGPATTEADILGLFGAFATKNDAHVVGTTVSASRGIAFVDYDSSAPVLDAVEQHQNEPFQLQDRVLDIYKKAVRHGGGGRGGGGYRGGGGRGGNSAYRGGGREQHRRGGGRGDRGNRGARDGR